ncbi:MAG: ribosomal L7Ae/L30e/S12e/Gadd45 family protein [Lachnospiraceae bacterium]|nr:ribosomal L7Ae/L30e/S12e/Gadd45 family protein [Lachnospiraceae bacterium]MBQ9562059.1 ribosomal L7Ae/L30e/S12e/Gadd45 family protein [Lachnospiraceae bacterium]MBQ9594171.1 ribosomal L7Ae/L30e/S12e/Gadd45 family protein [Lachnospiraceae bacterium]MBR0154204.1 ribosomal L7Ae/L30e/S12e/Gadd45 family protein [Lachnospiraceae bacterium]
MNNNILTYISLAQKAGKCASGEFSAEKAVKEHKAFCVIVAEDASANTRKLFQDKCAYRGIPCFIRFTKDELGRAIGKQSRASAAICDEGLARAIIERI